MLLTSFVLLFYFFNLSVGTSAEDLNQTGLICARPSHGAAKTLGIVKGLGLKHCQKTILKIPTQLGLQFIDKILRKWRWEEQ